MLSNPVGSHADEVEGLERLGNVVDVEAELESSELSSSRRSIDFFFRPMDEIADLIACELISSFSRISSECCANVCVDSSSRLR